MSGWALGKKRGFVGKFWGWGMALFGGSKCEIVAARLGNQLFYL